MTSVDSIVRKAIAQGHLTVEAEATLCELVNQTCNLTNVEALSSLQQAILSGRVKRLSQDISQDDRSEND